MRWQADVRARVGSLVLTAVVEGDSTPVVVVGPNGSGKTTLLRAIAGAVVPEKGRIRLGDRVLFDSATCRSVAPEERRFGYVPQGYGLFPHLSVLNNVAFGLAGGGRRATAARRRRAAAELLESMGCGGLRSRFPETLSGGERQRVALARALLPDPDLLLLDEPFAAMDAAARRTLRGYVADRLGSRGKPALVTTHDARDVRALEPDRVYALERGSVVQSGRPEELATRPATAFIAEFFAKEGEPGGRLEGPSGGPPGSRPLASLPRAAVARADPGDGC